jgi:hypothetical protein
VPDVVSCVQPVPAVIVAPLWISPTAMTVAPAAEGVTDPSDMPSAPVPDDPRFVAAATTSNAPTPDSSTAHPERNGALALKVAVTVAAPPVVTVAFQILSAWPAVASLIGEFVSCVYVLPSPSATELIFALVDRSKLNPAMIVFPTVTFDANAASGIVPVDPATEFRTAAWTFVLTDQSGKCGWRSPTRTNLRTCRR